MKRFLRENGLSIVTLGRFFLTFIGGQTFFGDQEYTATGRNMDCSPSAWRNISAARTSWKRRWRIGNRSSSRWGSTFFCTAFLYQKGSAESKKLGGPEAVDRDPRRFKNRVDAPWSVKRGGLILRLYENSLTLAFLLLFLVSFFLHGVGGRGNYNEEQLLHGQPAMSLLSYMTSGRFWFESFQNWQSEFLAIGCMVVFSIFLRQRGSPESKPVDSALADVPRTEVTGSSCSGGLVLQCRAYHRLRQPTS